jgi:DNA gyrase/topoisomerase IV subunit A
VITGPEVEEVMVGSAKAMVYRTAIKEIRTLGRNTQGVQVMTKLQPADQVISMSAFKERAWDEEPEPEPTPAPRASRATRGRSNGTAKKAAAEPAEVLETPASDEVTNEAEVGAPDIDAEPEQPEGQLGFGFDDEEPDEDE